MKREKEREGPCVTMSIYVRRDTDKQREWGSMIACENDRVLKSTDMTLHIHKVTQI